MAMLILGLGGFGVTNLSGSVRSVGSVGDQDIDVNTYARALQQDIRAIEAQTNQQITFQQAQAVGLDQAVLGRLVGAAALDHETQALGLSIGDENLRNQILNIPAFQGPTGSFEREAYEYALEESGLSQSKFEDQLRLETARTLLQGAVVSGIQAPDAFGQSVLNYVGERRDFTWARLDADNLETPNPEPTEEQLATYHQANIDNFTQPEMKQITYAWLSPNMIIDQVDVDETALRKLFEDRADELNSPERRLVERLGFADQASADAARAAIDSGTHSFEDFVSERGLALSDVDMGDVTQAELAAAGAGVFNAEIGQVVGPFDSNIGPALFRVNATLPGRVTAYEDVRDSLKHELAADRARRIITDQIDSIDDLLAAGATLEELEKETDMQLAQIDWYPDNGQDIAAYAEFNDAAATLAKGDYPKIAELEDGGIYAMRLEQILPARPQTLDEVRDRVIGSWQGQETENRLRSLADGMLPQLQGGETLASLGLTETIETDITREQFILGTPQTFLGEVFAMQVGDYKILDSFGTVLIVRLDAVNGPDMNEPEIQALQATLGEQLSNDIAQDLYGAFAQDIQMRAGIQIDQQALRAVHAQFQ